MSWIKTKFPRMAPAIDVLPAKDYHQEPPLIMTLDPPVGRPSQLVRLIGYEINDDCIVLFGKKKAIRPLRVEDYDAKSYRPLDKWAVRRYRHKCARQVTFRVPATGSGSVIIRLVNTSSNHQLVSAPKPFTFIPSWTEDEMLLDLKLFLGQESPYEVPDPELLDEPELVEIEGEILGPAKKPEAVTSKESEAVKENGDKPQEGGTEGKATTEKAPNATTADEQGDKGKADVAAEPGNVGDAKDGKPSETSAPTSTNEGEQANGDSETKTGNDDASKAPNGEEVEKMDVDPVPSATATTSADQPATSTDAGDTQPASGNDAAPAPNAEATPAPATGDVVMTDANGVAVAKAEPVPVAEPGTVPAPPSAGTAAPPATGGPATPAVVATVVPPRPGTPDDFIKYVPGEGEEPLTEETDPVDRHTALLHRLFFAAGCGYVKVVAAILDTQTCSANAADLLGQTVAHHAADGGHLTVLKLLAERDADFALRDGDGLLPIDKAARAARTACMYFLKPRSPPMNNQVFPDIPPLRHTAPITRSAPHKKTDITFLPDVGTRLTSAAWMDPYPELFLDSDDDEEVEENIHHYNDVNVCAFCHQTAEDSDIDVTGPMLGPFEHYWCHENCILWSKSVQFRRRPQPEALSALLPLNVPNEVKRAAQHMCSRCGRYGANLQCRVPKCSRRYHYSCALDDVCEFRYKEHHAVICPVHVPMDLGGEYGDIPRNPEIEAKMKAEEEEEKARQSRLQVVPTVSAARHIKPLVPHHVSSRPFVVPPRRDSGSRPRRDSGPPPRFEPVGPRPRRDSGGRAPKPRKRSSSKSEKPGSKSGKAPHGKPIPAPKPAGKVQTVQAAAHVVAAMRRNSGGPPPPAPTAGAGSKKRKRSRTLSTGSSTDLDDTNYRDRRSTRRDSEKADWFCQHCGIPDTETPARRPGPNGSSTLCNACGCYYKKHQRLPENPEERRLKHQRKKKKKKVSNT